MSTIIDRTLNALNARDLEAFVACYDPGATIEDGNDRVLARGHFEIRNRYGPMFEEFLALHVEPLGRWRFGSSARKEPCLIMRIAQSLETRLGERTQLS